MGKLLGSVLAADTDILASIPSKLAQINDNYMRCQNKLGITYSFSLDQILADAGGNFAIYGNQSKPDLTSRLEAPLKQMSRAGMRFVSVNAQLADASQVVPMAQAAAEFAKLAGRNNLKPIFNIGPNAGTAFVGNTPLIISFIQTAAEKSGGNEFIVPAYPRATFGIEQPGVIRDNSDLVAKTIAEKSFTNSALRNAIVTPPLMMMGYNPGCPGSGPVCVAFGPENDKLSLFADMNIFRAINEFNFDYYDMVLMGFDNYDIGFKDFSSDGLSKRSRLGSTHYQDDVKSWIKAYNDKVDAQKELQVLVMDFGPGNDAAGTTFFGDRNLILERLGLDFGIFSDDPTIAGVVLSSELYALAGLDTDFYSKMNLYGTNCNYDTVDYDTPYAASAAAPVCEVAPVPDSTTGPAKTRFVCSETEDKCYASIEFTLQIGLPIRNFGSNSASGTETQPYMPPSARAAISSSLPADFLNQFAGTITNSSGLKYTVPWLGNGINSSKIGIGSLVNSLPNTINLSKDLSDGSYPQFAIDEQLAETTTAPEYNNWTYNTAGKGKFNLRDEASICTGKDGCLNKVMSSAVDGLRAYDPDKQTFPTGIAGGMKCGGQVAAVNTDPQNYVYGSEQVVSKSSVEITKAQLAYKMLRGEVEYGGTFRPLANGSCPGTRGNGTGCMLTNANALQCNILPQHLVAGCFSNLDQMPTNYADSEIYYTAEFPDVGEFKIDGIYDALAANYNALQQAAAMQGEKIIFNENWGWEADVQIKAYSIAPRTSTTEGETNFGITASRRNNMLEFFNHSSVVRVDQPVQASTNSSNNGAEGNQCRVGINYAIQAGGVNSSIINQTKEFGYSHALVITIGAENEKTPTSNALNSLCQAGITPVLRSCYTGTCAFTGGAHQATFLNDVIKGAPACQKVVTTCGHNEPESENPNGFVNEGVWTRDCVNTFKSLNNPKVELTTPVFNSSHGELPNQLNEFFAGYNGGGSFNPSDFKCLAINAYSYANDPNRESIDHFNRIANDSRFGNLPVCIMETGIAEPGDGVQNQLALTELNKLFAQAGGKIEFALGFNWMGTNADSTWRNFVMSNANNEQAGQCRLDGSSGSEDNRTYSIPGEYMDNYNNYLAEGNNWQSEKHYYSMLGFMDEVNRLMDVYAYDTSGSRSLTDFALDRPRPCAELPASLRDKVNCVAPMGDRPDAQGYVADPLGKFLCQKGYNVIGEKCNISCVPDVVVSAEIKKPVNPACPLKDDRCWQGPTGDYSHFCRGGDPAFDLFNVSDTGVVVPEDGQIVWAEGWEDYICTSNLTKEALISANSSRTNGNAQAVIAYINSQSDLSMFQSSGGAVGFLGDSGIYYRLRHINITREEARQLISSKPRLTGGSALAVNGRTVELYYVPGPDGTPNQYGGVKGVNAVYTQCWRGAHLHTWAKVGVDTAADPAGTKTGQFADQYDVFDDLLGCKSVNSCGTADRPNDKRCEPPAWVSVTPGNTSTSPSACVIDGNENTDYQGPTTGCNEFNCGLGNPANGSFNNSLACASNTVSGDVAAGKHLGLLLDEYGPYCDNETRMVECLSNGRWSRCTAAQAAVAEDYRSYMPFVNNFLNVYNSYAPVEARCVVNIPRKPRLEDIGKSCSNFDLATLRSPENPAWQYYRAPLTSCSADKLTYRAGSTFGGVQLSDTQLVDKIINEVQYIGIPVGGSNPVPREKVAALVATARAKNVNPYVLVSMWATESYFGKSRPACNVLNQ